VTLKMPAFEWVHVQLHQQKGMISLSPPTICNSAGLNGIAWASLHLNKTVRQVPPLLLMAKPQPQRYRLLGVKPFRWLFQSE
ncbi:hypothetical protein ACRW46_24195, partial [Escherichia coli]